MELTRVGGPATPRHTRASPGPRDAASDPCGLTTLESPEPTQITDRGGMRAGSQLTPGTHISRRTTPKGAYFIAVPIGHQGQLGTRASAFSASMAATMARTPVSVSTMNGALST